MKKENSNLKFIGYIGNNNGQFNNSELRDINSGRRHVSRII